ncbi:Helix-loop-helix DNA-binding protein [Metarhizium guizhouense ARSEF 977]|uniref:Helix-loop-helix DNA-binding protein n=1 Tax=Metarhizium guizhouense (strain ARSEF 977) TaxID=1276136 RepID=A0A0B4GT01_METGA|nr:Helix-loop-helix DNA-binding protein [Metarhizium guizhouense ARSEF 977]
MDLTCMAWLDSLDECGAVSDGGSSSSNEALPSPPTSESSLPSDFSLPDQEWAIWRPCSPDLIFPEHGSAVESDISQDAGEFGNLPSPTPIHVALVDCQLTSLNWGSAAEATGASSSEMLPPLKQMAKPYHPRCDSVDDKNPSSFPGYNSEGSSGGQKSTIKGRKRTQARPAKKPGGNATHADGTPVADIGKINKAYLRSCHNKVEKNYRDRLNNEFNMLLDLLSDYMDETDLVSAGLTVEGSRSRSKGSILRLARWRLQALKAENRSIAGELEIFRQAWAQWSAPRSGL